MNAHFELRAAEPRDLTAIVGLIAELAEFEHLGHLLQVTPERLRPHLFGDQPVAQCLVAEVASPAAPPAGPPTAPPQDQPQPVVVGFALYFRNFSTFLAQPGLYLEDLYVQPAHRGTGIGRALLQRLGALAVAQGCGRFEWSVLDWNENAIRFYEKMGAQVMPDWRICRVSGAALQRFAQA